MIIMMRQQNLILCSGICSRQGFVVKLNNIEVGTIKDSESVMFIILKSRKKDTLLVDVSEKDRKRGFLG